jgi:hypothetical protein
MRFKETARFPAPRHAVVTVPTLTIHPAHAVRGTLEVPGDKSISHRCVLLGALADGTTTVTNLSPGADVAATVACLRALGADIAPATGHGLRIQGRGPAATPAPPCGCWPARWRAAASAAPSPATPRSDDVRCSASSTH